MVKPTMDKQLRRGVQPRILENKHLSIIDKLNPMTNLKKHKGISAAGVLFLARDTGRCLFQLRNSDKKQKNTWGFWGGLMEGTETPYECIRRELAEELGFFPDISKLNPIDTFQSKNKNFM